jgi:hypothetical protein
MRAHSASSTSRRDAPTKQSGFGGSPDCRRDVQDDPPPDNPPRSRCRPEENPAVALNDVVALAHGLERVSQNLVTLAQRPVDHRAVLVVQHVERDVHQLEILHAQRLPLGDLIGDLIGVQVYAVPVPVVPVPVVPVPVLDARLGVSAPFSRREAARAGPRPGPLPARRLRDAPLVPPPAVPDGVHQALDVPERRVRLVTPVPHHQLAVEHAFRFALVQPRAEQSVERVVPARPEVVVVPREVVERGFVHPVHLYPLAVELGLDRERFAGLPHRLERLRAAARARRHHRLHQRTRFEVLPLEALAARRQRLADATQIAAQVVQINGVRVVLS